MHEHFETTGNRQMELGYDIFCVGSGEHSPIFIFFSPTREISNPSSISQFPVVSKTSSEIKLLPLPSHTAVPPLCEFKKCLSAGHFILRS